MDIKKIVQESVPKNEDLFEKIQEFSKQNSWIYLKDELLERLIQQCKYVINFWASPKEYVFSIESQPKQYALVVGENENWNEVLSIREKENNNQIYEKAIDPEIIVFLYP